MILFADRGPVRGESRFRHRASMIPGSWLGFSGPLGIFIAFEAHSPSRGLRTWANSGVAGERPFPPAGPTLQAKPCSNGNTR